MQHAKQRSIKVTGSFRDILSGLTVTVIAAVAVVIYDAVEHFDASNFLVAESWVPIVGAAIIAAIMAAMNYIITYLLPRSGDSNVESESTE